MIEKIDLERVLVLDIETVSACPEYDSLSEDWKELWKRKSSSFRNAEEETPESLYSRAGIYAEFGKVISISLGVFRQEQGHYRFYVKSFYGREEKTLLEEFAVLLRSRFDSSRYVLAAHNGKEFDFPYLSRRMLVNGVSLPFLLNTPGKKPWEVPHLDTMELWKFGDYKSYVSLQLLTRLFDIPTPKEDMDGSRVGEVYWKENNLEKISDYCRKDVIAVAQLLLRFQGKRLLTGEEIIFAEYDQ
jgi:predicted PolB exonuclease-like 3'-5' exonuclease